MLIVILLHVISGIDKYSKFCNNQWLHEPTLTILKPLLLYGAMMSVYWGFYLYKIKSTLEIRFELSPLRHLQ